MDLVGQFGPRISLPLDQNYALDKALVANENLVPRAPLKTTPYTEDDDQKASHYLIERWKKAGRPIRKHRPDTAITDHAEEVAEASVAAISLITSSPSIKYYTKVISKLHDLGEDYLGSWTFDEVILDIDRRFGRQVGDAVERSSTPPLHELLIKYPDISANYFNGITPSNLPSKEEALRMIKDIKTQNPHANRAFKREVTMKSKADKGAEFSIPEAISKMEDVIHSLNTLSDDLAFSDQNPMHAILVMKQSPDVEPPARRAKSNSPPSTISTTWLGNMIKDRTEMQSFYMSVLKERFIEEIANPHTAYKINMFGAVIEKLEHRFGAPIRHLEESSHQAELEAKQAEIPNLNGDSIVFRRNDARRWPGRSTIKFTN